MSRSTLLRILNLKTYYFTEEGIVKAVDGVNLDVNENDALGIVGESGCGKSTLGLSILRLVPIPGRIVSGRIEFEGRNLLELTSDEMRYVRGRKISMIFQDPSTALNPVYSVRSQLAEAFQLQGIKNKKELRAKMVDILRKVGISDPERRLNQYPHELSGGMKQRVMIAIALSCRPKLLIADEPTTSLDVTIEAQILDLMKKLMNDFKISLILITHNLGIVSELCNRIAIMYAGKIIEEGLSTTIFRNPLHPYTEALLRAVPKVEKPPSRLPTIHGSVASLLHPPRGCRFHPRCKFLMDICKQKEPPFVEVERAHHVACWLYT